MIKRIVLLCSLICSFLTFYYFIPFKIFSHSPILFSGVFSFVTVVLIGLTILNIGGLNEWKLLRTRTKGLNSFWTLVYVVAILSFTGLFFIYLFNFIGREETEFAVNSKATKGIILDKWTEKATRRFKNDSFTHIKVKYKADNKEIISEHITTMDLMIDIPDIGQSIKIFYSRSNPEKFETDWERRIREYDPIKDPENIKRKMFLDSVLKARER